MKFLFDLLPVILFFAGYKWAEGNRELVADWLTHYMGFAVATGVVTAKQAPVLLATVVVVVATILQVLTLKIMRKPVDRILWASLAVVVVLGGLTLWFNNEAFIMWKPTVVYWIMGIGFLVTEVILKKRMLKQMMGGQMEVPDGIWIKVGWAWALFFIGMGFLNLYVAFVFYANDTDAWVTFKTWGTLALTLLFIVAQGVYLSRHMVDESPKGAKEA
ncbi:MAG: septation protein A [Aquabacterium sp.]